MILNECKQEVIVSSGGFKEKEFKLKNKEFIFDILSDKIYTNKIGAIVREIISNAIDANVEVKSNKKIHIHFPTVEEPFFSIRDFGPGLNSERVNVFVSFGDSTKRESADQIGYFGMGSKSPFAYTDSFYITTWVGGHQNEYMAYIGDDRKRSLMLLNRTKNDSEQGTEIKINIKSSYDYAKFREEFKIIWGYCIDKFTFNSDYNHFVETLYIPDQYQKFHSRFDVMFGRYDTYPRNTFTVLNGNVAYRVDVNTLYLLDNYYKMSETIKTFDLFSNQNIVLKFKVGELKLSVSRESLEICEQNAKAIETKLAGLMGEIRKNIQAEYDKGFGNVVKMRYFFSRYDRISNIHYNRLSNSEFIEYIRVSAGDYECKKHRTTSGGFNVLQSQNYFYYICGEIDSVEGRVRRFFHNNPQDNIFKFIKFETQEGRDIFKKTYPFINLCNMRTLHSIAKKREKKEKDQKLIDGVENGHIDLLGSRLKYEHFVNEVNNLETQKYYITTGYGKVVVNESLMSDLAPNYSTSIIQDNPQAAIEFLFENKVKIFKFAGTYKNHIPKHWIPIETLFVNLIKSNNIPEKTYRSILHMTLGLQYRNRKMGYYLPDRIQNEIIYTYFKIPLSERRNGYFNYFNTHIRIMNLVVKHNKTVRNRLAKDIRILRKLSKQIAYGNPGLFVEVCANKFLNEIRTAAERSAIKMIKENLK